MQLLVSVAIKQVRHWRRRRKRWCWKLHTRSRSRPVLIDGPQLEGAEVMAIAAGDSHSIAASRDVGGTGTRADAGGIIGGQNEGRNARNTRQAAYADALARDRALKGGPGRDRPDQRQRAKSGTPPGWYVDRKSVV